MSEEIQKPKRTKEVAKIYVRPVYGFMVNMLTNQMLTGVTEVPEIDGWMKAQIEAGKLEIVTP